MKDIISIITILAFLLGTFLLDKGYWQAWLLIVGPIAILSINLYIKLRQDEFDKAKEKFRQAKILQQYIFELDKME